LRFLDDIAPLLGATPRSAKRFVNLYQLTRVVYRASFQPIVIRPTPNSYRYRHTIIY
jgi:hypothetical protein